MFKRKKRKYRRILRPRSKRHYDNRIIGMGMSPETKRGILAVLFLALGLISLLSRFGIAGSAGNYIDITLASVFGVVRWLIPIILIILGYFLMRPEKHELTLGRFIGLFLFILSFNGLTHLIFHKSNLSLAAKSNLGGGYAGLVLSFPLLKLLGFWASLILLLALTIIGILLFFNTSLSNLSETLARLRGFFEKISNLIFKIRIKIAQRKKEKMVAEAGIKEKEEEVSFAKKEIEPFDSAQGKEEVEEDKDKEEREPKQLSLDITKFKDTKIEIPIDLLNGKIGRPTSGDIKANTYIIKKTLENFRIPVEMGEVNVGPTVTQYTLKPAEGVKLSKITALNNDLALALASHPIRIEAPIPGRSLVGIEVPNQAVAVVTLKEILTGEEFKNKKSNLTIVLGKDVKGKPWMADLASMPHLLIAGSTGSGKSVCIKSVIVSLLYQNGPGQLKFILVDPKRVELPIYNGIPHLLTPVITEVDKTVNALKWAIGEMEKRFELLSSAHAREIDSYNQKAKEKMPYIIIIIDELADLMAARGVEVEAAIIRLAQMARAVGIHLIVATQRPSVDILTGLIKANITSRIAFSVASLVDSRTILDMSGAEKLLGRGDMLFVSAEISKPKRLQGAYTSDEEIKKIVEFLKEKAKPKYLEEVVEKQKTGLGEVELTPQEGEGDELLSEAKEVILRAGKASASLLQRRLRIGYARAARLLDLLEEQGFVGSADGAKPREILAEGVEEEEDFEDDLEAE